MNLPEQPGLPINLLAACFNKTAATYKFYWLLAILDKVELGKVNLSKQELFAGMVAHAWFTVNYFHVSFGVQDQLQQAVRRIILEEGLTVDADRSMIVDRLAVTANRITIRILNHFDAEVPHRFLSPWFPAADVRVVREVSQLFTNNCLYALYKDRIELNPAWTDYLQRNAGILKSFCYWQLAMYLQAKNPNVPDIPNKLIRSPVRKNLNAQRKLFWDSVIGELGGVDCIYTNSRLQIGAYAVEHFIPYAFVSHDLVWNLIPADRSFNSSKGDKLPVLATHFDAFYELQAQAVEIIQVKSPKNKFLEDYLTLFPALTSEYLNAQKFLEQIQPLVTIASNNGFEYLKAY